MIVRVQSTLVRFTVLRARPPAPTPSLPAVFRSFVIAVCHTQSPTAAQATPSAQGTDSSQSRRSQASGGPQSCPLEVRGGPRSARIPRSSRTSSPSRPYSCCSCSARDQRTRQDPSARTGGGPTTLRRPRMRDGQSRTTCQRAHMGCARDRGGLGRSSCLRSHATRTASETCPPYVVCWAERGARADLVRATAGTWGSTVGGSRRTCDGWGP